MVKLAISGAQGRMGQTIANLAAKDKTNFQLAALLEHKNHPKANEKVVGISVSTDNNAIKGCDCLIEFTLPEATIANLEACLRHRVKMVIGTTGLNEQQEKIIGDASRKIPIVYASNMSIGVNTLFKLIEISGKSLQGLTDIYIGETHHIHKKDKPSGTAKTMKKIAEATSRREVRFDEKNVKREGEVVGYHEITFETEFDTLKITHNAKDRSMFALGALQAAKFLKDKKSGLFNMQDVLGLK
ncbi:MAG TPA: 4-hydroxy-tetrahydrodipicolinate reductase [Candidatus Omnitrophota bacterium]|nr:4-hydroxy-tetrahydrodipicolinate reductase [Candidatus Omnitrophota bacterium]